jgi:hypothetical protein
MNTYDRQPPQDLAAEMSVLGGMLLSRDAIAAVLRTFGDRGKDVFYRPAHQMIYDAVVDRFRADEPADPVTVAAALQARGMLGRVGGAPYLIRLIESVPTAANSAFYAEIVAEKATLRRLVEAGTRVVQLGYSDATGDQVEGVAIRAQEAVQDAVNGSLTPSGDFDATSLADLVCEPEKPEDWVVPNLLERGDRLIITGWEGTGKSEAVVQLALAVAGGIHPFTADPIKELDGGTQRVLIVDVENTRRQLRRRLGRVAAIVDHIRRGHGLDPVDWRTAVKVVIRPDGVDLSRPAESAHLAARCAEMAPDLLVAGPLYKMTGWNTHEEEGALKLLQTLDRLRVKHNCAVISEHHTPHPQNGQARSTRPIGSSVMLRWPEFGLGIVKHPDGNPDEEHPSWVQVRRWRGGREVREWPWELRHGGEGRLPWVPTEEYWDQVAKPTRRV